MLLAEDLLLLVTDDASGRLCVPASQVDAGLGGANLLELALRNKLGLTGEHDTGQPGRIVVRDPAATGDAVLDAAGPAVIDHGGPAWRAFTAVGWTWGGDWSYPLDYTHFSANGQ
jgi:hypothetical protein